MPASQRDIDFLRSIGKCASQQSKGGYLCTLSANHVGKDHLAQVLGGQEDGKVLAQWPW